MGNNSVNRRHLLGWVSGLSAWRTLRLLMLLLVVIFAVQVAGNDSAVRAASKPGTALVPVVYTNKDQPFINDEVMSRREEKRLLKDAPDACKNPPADKMHTLKECVGKDKDKTVIIGSGADKKECQGTVYVNKDSADLSVGNITINTGGTLAITDETASEKNVTLVTTGIDVNGGSFLVGSADCPIGTIKPTDTVTIRFTGNKPTTCGQLSQPGNNCPGYQKGIQLEASGTLRMYGLKGVPPNGVDWTELSQPAGDPLKFSTANGILAPPPKDKNIIYTAARVDTGTGAWRAGDWIAVATTSFSPWETEFVQIASVGQDTDNAGATGSKITLRQGLQYYHFGGANPGLPSAANYNAGAATNFGIDERAEVGLISRNILLTSDSDEGANTPYWGGEIKILQGFTAVSLQGVELQKFGKQQLGSYPIHFHMDGDLSSYAPANLLVDSNSIDHSYNKCITVHSTQNLSITNNVCARITGHIFYEEVGNETNITFQGNLGMGAMSNSFDVNATGTGGESRDKLIQSYYWTGDNMFSPPTVSSTNVFNQFNIFDTDNQNNPQGGAAPSPIAYITTRGDCGFFNNLGMFVNTGPPGNTTPITCYPGNSVTDKTVYFEPPSGFWILNPSAKLIGNSIAGCQDTGSAYWYASPPDPNLNAVKFIAIGPNYTGTHGVFQNNRGHGCYRGLIDDQLELSTADSLFPFQNGVKSATNHPMVDEFDGFTVTRIRDRAIWLRPVFFFVDNARMATNRRGISFVTSGGADGNYPGVWSLLSGSTMAGMTQNNVDRFGPCGSKVPLTGKQLRGGSMGCIDQTVPISGVATGGEFVERGYDTPDWNMFGFMSYDGPPLIVGDRFVNFLVNPSTMWTTTDKSVISSWNFLNGYTHYEGDAAIGWLDSNQSAYPTAASAEKLSFTNVDFRHQVFTQQVNLDGFNDGDQNTAILDLDGTLSGYTAGNSTGAANGSFPISLNNLPFNQSSNSVDECRATGQQNTDLEGRPTALMTASSIGQLEFESQYPINPTPPWPANDHSQLLSFYKDSLDFGQHGSMSLHSRNGLGVWEPKVTSGYGYVVRADPYTRTGVGTSGAGIPALIDISLVDTVDPDITATNPFYIQLGICYTNSSGGHPASSSLFTITHGYRSWGSGNLEPTDQALRKYYNELVRLSSLTQWCNNLDYQQANNLPNPTYTGCPADGVALMNGSCPAGTTPITDLQGQTSCLYPKNTPALTSVTSLAAMTTNGALNGPPNPNNYFYDSTTGMLYLWIQQTDANAFGPSPLGVCTGSSSDPPYCPQATNGLSTGESYYNCPAEGCPTYRVVLSDSTYTPGVSTCPVYGTATGTANDWLTGTGGATWPGPPADEPVLVMGGSIVARTTPVPSPLPHYAPSSAPTCAINQ